MNQHVKNKNDRQQGHETSQKRARGERAGISSGSAAAGTLATDRQVTRNSKAKVEIHEFKSSKIDVNEFGSLAAKQQDCSRQNTPPQAQNNWGGKLPKSRRWFFKAAAKEFQNGLD